VSHWHPSASLTALRQRDAVLSALRARFQTTGSLEVSTPSLSTAATTDPYIDSYGVDNGNGSLWLHTSPEFPMKRLLAAYAVDIHQFATVYRIEESGRHHNREFAMLEWYRIGADLTALIDDAVQLINTAANALDQREYTVEVISYQDAVNTLCGDYPHRLSVASIADVFAANHRSFPESLLASNSTDDALTLLVDEFVVREFPAHQLTALTEYPASQASLAKTTTHASGHTIALRAELFLGSVEIANGFEELTDAQEQAQRPCRWISI